MFEQATRLFHDKTTLPSIGSPTYREGQLSPLSRSNSPYDVPNEMAWTACQRLTFSRNRILRFGFLFLVIITPEDLDCALRIIRIQTQFLISVSPSAYADGSIDSIFRTDAESHQVFSGRADIDCGFPSPPFVRFSQAVFLLVARKQVLVTPTREAQPDQRRKGACTELLRLRFRFMLFINSFLLQPNYN